MDRFIVGSRAFFSCYEDFKPSDEDVLILDDNPTDYKFHQEIRIKGNCIFRWKRMNAQEFVDYHKKLNTGMFIGKFIVPEFTTEIGLTIEQLAELRCLAERLDERHQYERIIFDSYIKNNEFVLTEEQRLSAYNNYKSSRKTI